jgi:hypothetical protein
MDGQKPGLIKEHQAGCKRFMVIRTLSAVRKSMEKLKNLVIKT